MDYKKTLDTIKKILVQNSKDKICIFIDGQWGIGKTYTLKEFQDHHNEIYDIKYISVFGKDDLKSIEKELVMQMMPIFNSKKDALDKTELKLFGNVIKKIGEIATGTELNFSDIVSNISIESINADTNIIICIDDLERKSKNIEMKDLLGLIERASSKFNVILIGSSINLEEGEKNDFLHFKEKVIDFSFFIDELSNNTLEKIIEDKIDAVNSTHMKVIIDAFRKSRIHNDIPLNNLRIFKKYIDLIQRLNIEINRLLKVNGFKLDHQLIELCNYITYKNYLEHEIKNSKIDNKLNFYKEELSRVIECILRYEEYDEAVIIEYYEDYSEIQEDIRKLRTAYKLTNEDIINILVKIEEYMTEENTGYFIKQKYVISLYDVLKEIGIIKKFSGGLFNIVEKLYKPEIEKQPEVFEYSDWNEFNYCGEIQNYRVLDIINHINEHNTKTYEFFLDEQLCFAVENDDLESASKVLKYVKIEDEAKFKKVFHWAFAKMDNNFREDVWNALINLIYSTDSDIVIKMFADMKGQNTDYIRAHRLNVLQEELNERRYFEYEAEQERLHYLENNN